MNGLKFADAERPVGASNEDSTEFGNIDRQGTREAVARFQLIHFLIRVELGKVGCVIHVRDWLNAENFSIVRTKNDEIGKCGARCKVNAHVCARVFNAYNSVPVREAVVEIDYAEIFTLKEIGQWIEGAPVLRDPGV